jgi:hypothetical protein
VLLIAPRSGNDGQVQKVSARPICKDLAMTFGPLPDGFKLCLEIYREIPVTGFRARIEKHPDATDSIDPGSALGRWRYIDHTSDLEDYLLNVRPTHYFQWHDSVVPLLIARDLELVERLPGIGARVMSSKRQSFFIAGGERSQTEGRLAHWDARPRWRLGLNRKSVRDVFELAAKPDGTAAPPFTTDIRIQTQAAFVEFLRRLDPDELEIRGPGSAVRRSVLIGLDGNFQAVAAQMHRDLNECGHSTLLLRHTTLEGVHHRLETFRPTTSNEQA